MYHRFDMWYNGDLLIWLYQIRLEKNRTFLLLLMGVRSALVHTDTDLQCLPRGCLQPIQTVYRFENLHFASPLRQPNTRLFIYFFVTVCKSLFARMCVCVYVCVCYEQCWKGNVQRVWARTSWLSFSCLMLRGQCRRTLAATALTKPPYGHGSSSSSPLHYIHSLVRHAWTISGAC